MAIENLRARAQQIDERESAVHAREDALRIELLALIERAQSLGGVVSVSLAEGLMASLEERSDTIERRAEMCRQWASLLSGLREHIEKRRNAESISALRAQLTASLTSGAPSISAELIERVVQNTLAEVTDQTPSAQVDASRHSESEAIQVGPGGAVPLGESLEAAVFDDFGLMEFEFAGVATAPPSPTGAAPAEQIDGTFASFWTLPGISREGGETDPGATPRSPMGDIDEGETSFADLDALDLQFRRLEDPTEQPAEMPAEKRTLEAPAPTPVPIDAPPPRSPTADGYTDPFATLPGGLPAAFDQDERLGGLDSADEPPVQEFVDSLVAALAQFDSVALEGSESAPPPPSKPPDLYGLQEPIDEGEADAALTALIGQGPRPAAPAGIAPAAAPPVRPGPPTRRTGSRQRRTPCSPDRSRPVPVGRFPG